MSTRVRTAMLMAAGLGTRMRPLTNDRPKPLVQVAGQALIDHALDRIEAGGIERVVVNVHYLPDQVEAHLQARRTGMEILISDERDELLETGGGLMKAAPLLGDAPFLCANSDNIWTDTGQDSISMLSGLWDDDRMDALLLLVPRERATCHGGPGDFHLGEDGRLSRCAPDATAPYVFTGVQIMSPHYFRDPDTPKLVAEGDWYAPPAVAEKSR